MDFVKLEVIGLGYIGLPTALIFANQGIDVVGVDLAVNVVNTLNQGIIPIKEKGLEHLLKQALKNKLFRAESVPEKADVFLIAVPTPYRSDKDRSCDVSAIISAITGIIPFLEKGNTLIIESTIAPGVMTDVVLPLIEAQGFHVGKDFFVAHCPERVLPGNIIQEIVNNSRIIGGITPNCQAKVKKIYETVVTGDIHLTTAPEAELIKLVENTYRDINIANGNELVKICHHLGADVHQVIGLANQHPRVNIHSPGPGVGGHCLAVDPNFIVASAPMVSPLIQTARRINNSMPEFVVSRIEELMAKGPTNKLTILGMAYKGNVNDMRESPSLTIVNQLQQNGYQVAIYDPCIDDYATDFEGACRGSSLLVVLTDHDEFKEIFESQTNAMANPQIFDTKNCVEIVPESVAYHSFGNQFAEGR